jgi:hypothetical protein
VPNFAISEASILARGLDILLIVKRVLNITLLGRQDRVELKHYHSIIVIVRKTVIIKCYFSYS